jgi:hypothetical protein
MNHEINNKRGGNKMRNVAIWVLLALLATAGLCYAVEEDDDGNIRQSQPLALDGDDSVAPKPKVIIKERVVMKCAPGMVWSPRNKRCISEDGEAAPAPRYQAPAPQQQIATPRGDRYVYPGTKLRIKMGKCTMQGETVTCELGLTNTAEGATHIVLEHTAITDENGESYKSSRWAYISGHRGICCQPSVIDYGHSANVKTSFPLVNPSATMVTHSMLIKANNGSDLVKFSGISLLK